MSLLADHLWQSTLFAGAVWLLTSVLRKNSARVRHWLWFAASLKFLIPFSLLLTLGSHFDLKKAPPRSTTPATPFIMEVSQPFTTPVFSAPLPATTPPARIPLPSILFGVWAGGFIGISVSWWIRWRRLQSAVRAASPLHLHLPIKAMSSPTLIEPGVFGVFRPILLLPEGITDRLTQEQLQAVIAHELCHVRHRDNLIAAIHMFVETVFWFHPLIWWIGTRMVEERERACDEEVLSATGEPKAYAEGILNVCKLYVESPLECVSGVGGANLKKRIEAIMSNRIVLKLSPGKRVALAAATVIAVAAPVIIGFVNAPSIRAQSAAPQKFDVASIRLGCGGNAGGGGGGKGKAPDGKAGTKGGGAIPATSPGRLSACNALLVHFGGGQGPYAGFIPDAYGKYANGHGAPPWAVPSVEGGPEWVKTDFYTISATAEGNPSEEVMRGPMMQALLEDRFKLKMHRETREGPVYALTVAKGGPKLQPFKEGSCVLWDWTAPRGTLPPMLPQQQQCGASLMRRNPPNAAIDVQGATLQVIAYMLGLPLDRPVVDRTGIAGLFDIHLEFGPEGSSMGPPPPPPPGRPTPEPSDPGPSIFTAIQEQLGLKLEPAKGPLDVLVIDHIERPSEN
jgi:bla regulator protein BlaR1